MVPTGERGSCLWCVDSANICRATGRAAGSWGASGSGSTSRIPAVLGIVSGVVPGDTSSRPTGALSGADQCAVRTRRAV